MTSLQSALWLCCTKTTSAVSSECLTSVMVLCSLHIHPLGFLNKVYLAPELGPSPQFHYHCQVVEYFY